MSARTYSPELIATINTAEVLDARAGYTGRQLADYILRREVKDYRDHLAALTERPCVDPATRDHIERLKATIRHLCFRIERMAMPAGVDTRTDAERESDRRFQHYAYAEADRRVAA